MKIQKDTVLDFEVEALRLKLHRAHRSGDHETVRIISAIFDGITLERIQAHNLENAAKSYGSVNERR